MLQLVFGQSGSGKTTLLHHMAAKAAEHSTVYLVVPEQNSFDTERALYEDPATRAVEVYSFTRLCDRIFRTLGGIAGQTVGESGRRMLMTAALDAVKDRLIVYRNYAHRPAFVGQMCGAVDELKNAGIFPETLLAMLGDDASPAAQKLRELGEIYTVFQALLDKTGQDGRDDLARAAALARDNNFFADKVVLFDGFKGFTGAQDNLLAVILAQSPETTVSLCMESLSDETMMFTSCRRTANELIQTAKRLGVAVKTPQTLVGTYRFATPALQTVAENFVRAAQETCEKTDGVELYRAKTAEEEYTYVAATIRRLTQEGYRYRDMAVVARTLPSPAVLQEIFARFDIPLYLDQLHTIHDQPLVKLLFSLFAAVEHPRDVDSLFALLKSSFSPFAFETVCALENYAFVWNLSRDAFKEPFQNHPRGMSRDWTPADTETLASFNALRERVQHTLDTFAAATAQTDGVGFAKALVAFLRDFGVTQAVEEQLNILPDEDARRLGTVYNLIIDCAEQIALVLQDAAYDLPRLATLFRAALGDCNYGNIPQTADALTIGTAERIRYVRPRVVFVVGAAEGVFPALLPDDPLIGSRERALLRENGVKLHDHAVEDYADERYFAYTALSAPSERLYVSYPLIDWDGSARQGSLIVSQLQKLLPSLTEQSRDTVDPTLFLQTTAAALRTLATDLFDDTTRALVAAGDPQTVKMLLDRTTERDFNLTDPTLGRALFGKTIAASATRVENFHRCPFMDFCERGLKVKPLRQVKLDAMESGSFIHFCLYELIGKEGKEGFVALSDEQIATRCDELCERYIRENLHFETAPDERFYALLSRFKNTVWRLARRLRAELKDSDFYPVAFEQKIDENEAVAPFTVTFPGGEVKAHGTVDRIDLYEQDGTRYIRVVDYKSGPKDFKIEQVAAGLNIQMLLYLFAATGGGVYAGSLPAGVLYAPVGDAFLKIDRHDTPEQKETEALKKGCAKGLVLNDVTVVQAMDKNPQPLFIPVKYKKDGSFDARSSLADAETFTALHDTVRAVLGEMGKAMHGGKIAPHPTSHYDVCKHCAYKAVCKRQGD